MHANLRARQGYAQSHQLIGDCSQIHGYLIQSLRFRDSDTTSHFWQLQTSVVTELRALCSLQIVVAIVIPDHNGKCVKSFYNVLKSAGWCLTSTDTSFPTHGDTISGLCHIIIGIHTSCAPTVEPLQLKSPPRRPCSGPSACPFGSHSIGRNILSRWQWTTTTSCDKM